MKNLKSIYALFNDAMDQFDKYINEVNKHAAGEIRNIILDKSSYSEPLTDQDIKTIDDIYTNMVSTMEKNENTLYVNHIVISGFVLDALFLKGDFELLDILRSSKPFCLLSDDAKTEIKAILNLFEIHDVSQMELVGNKLCNFQKANNLPTREMICYTSRQYKGLAS